jgi:peptide/nickel transport system ATP-binding protein
MASDEPILKVEDLRTYFQLDEGTLKAVDGVSFELFGRRTLGIIGESGCGKSVTAQSILRIVPDPGRIVGGRMLFKRSEGDEVDLAALDHRGEKIRSIRGKRIAMIFQEPMTSFSPVHTVGSQIVEAIMLHRTSNEKKARQIAIEMIDRVGIPNAPQRFTEYPFQFSGGMRQRAMIAMALSCDPDILVADEPTTALDVTIQAQILDLIKELQEQFGMAVLFITHDLGVIAEISEQVAVMYLGRVVELGSASHIFKNPLHPYTRSLLKSIPRLGARSGGRLEVIKGTVPMPLDFPEMCGFYSRCPAAMRGQCDVNVPDLVELEDRHWARCFLHSDRVDPAPTMTDAFSKKKEEVAGV